MSNSALAHENTNKGLTRTLNPLNSFKLLLSLSHVIIRNSALSAPVSVAVAACYKTCMANLLVWISQYLTVWNGWRAHILLFARVALWFRHVAVVLPRYSNGGSKIKMKFLKNVGTSCHGLSIGC